VGLVGRHTLPDLAADGIAPDSGEDAGVKRGQRRHEIREQGQRRDPAVGDDERSPDVLRVEVIRDERAGAGAEVNGGRKAESGKGHRGARKKIMWFLSK
jgi:hypothetical protein